MQTCSLRYDHTTMDRFLPGYSKEIPPRLIRCLNDNAVRYDIRHEPDCLGQVHAPVGLTSLIHAAVVRAGKQRLLAVLPDGRDLDFKKLARLIGHPVRLETEEEFKWLFPDCALAAIPPFGNLYGLPTWVDSSLAKTKHIVFRAGTLIDSIKLAYSSYVQIVRPNLGDFSINPVSIT
jgi:Ala-tRNA(Pro) deacylase